MITSRIKYVVLGIIIICIFILMNTTKPPDKYNEVNQLVNIHTEAKKIDKKRFLDYKVSKANESSELIAVIFNTSEKYNVGFINEQGNVIKEPFLKQPWFNFNDCRDGTTSFTPTYIQGYYYDVNSKKYFDREFKAVSLSNKEKDEFLEAQRIRKNSSYNLSDANQSIPVQLKEKVCKDFKISEADMNVEYDGNLYQIDFSVEGTLYTVFYNNSFDIQGNMIFSDGDYNQFEFIDSRANVGAIFVRNVGMVYFNMDGEIIWITYSIGCNNKN